MAQNRHHARRTKGVAATAVDPFGLDGFGDSWDQPKAAFDSDSDAEEPQWQEELPGPDFDWGTSVVSRQQASTKHQQHEERLHKIAADMAAAKEHMKRGR